MNENSLDDNDSFIVRFSAWEGPIEAMLELAKTQKIDLLQIDILELVSQFEHVVTRALSLRLDLAAEWLVMASWLTYLKSKILLRRPKGNETEDIDEDALAFHLRRLEAVKGIAPKLPARMQLGRDWYGPGGSAGSSTIGSRLAMSFHDFLASYPKKRIIEVQEQPVLKPFDLATVDGAIQHLKEKVPDSEWTELISLVPSGYGLRLKSNIATSLIGALELTKNGYFEIKQSSLEEPIYVRRIIDTE